MIMCTLHRLINNLSLKFSLLTLATLLLLHLAMSIRNSELQCALHCRVQSVSLYVWLSQTVRWWWCCSQQWQT